MSDGWTDPSQDQGEDHVLNLEETIKRSLVHDGGSMHVALVSQLN